MYKVYLLDDVEDWLFKLPQAERKEMFTLLRMLEELGYELNKPYKKQLVVTKEKIKELRCRRFGNRSHYIHHNNKIYVGLLGGNKCTQDRDIKKADKIAKRIKKSEVLS